MLDAAKGRNRFRDVFGQLDHVAGRYLAVVPAIAVDAIASPFVVWHGYERSLPRPATWTHDEPS
jgi:hypothetical protein